MTVPVAKTHPDNSIVSAASRSVTVNFIHVNMPMTVWRPERKRSRGFPCLASLVSGGLDQSSVTAISGLS